MSQHLHQLSATHDAAAGQIGGIGQRDAQPTAQRMGVLPMLPRREAGSGMDQHGADALERIGHPGKAH